MRTAREELGPYRIVRKLAVGGMAEIYLARQRGIEGLERLVVLKQILAKHEQSEEFVTMFLDEARLMAALSHPNVAQVLDLARADDTHYLVMEYVRGPTLGAMLAAARRAGVGQGGIPERPALGIALAIAQALHYVHERRDELGRPLGIVHRDLNPANVLVSYDGAVKLIDFGIAKAATKVYETRTGVIKGTYGYIAPEALTGSADVDRRADVFALGILLYEMLVGKHPFDASDEPNLLDRILEARYKRPRDVRPDLPAALDAVVARCLAPHPEGRPASMRELIDALASHMAAAGIVPTELDLAALARRLVPDEEGPAPLRRPTATQPRPVFPREAPAKDGGTRKVPTEAPLEGDPTERGLPRIPADPQGIPADPQDTRKIAAPPADARAVALPEPVHEAPTWLGPRQGAADEPWPPADADDGATVPASSRLVHPIPPPAAPLPAPAEATARLRAAEPRRVVQPVLGAIGLVVAGVAAFAAARALGPARPPDAIETLPPVPMASLHDAGASSAIPRALWVVSEPPGAAIAVDGVDLAMRTPAVIAIDPRLPRVQVNTSLEGYLPQAREVSTVSRETRFVLQAAPPDAEHEAETERPAGAGYGPDAGPQAAPEADTEAPTRRRRVRRRAR